ncbi:hypothetical protein EDD11_009570, partial [Mortierella claussenii]
FFSAKSRQAFAVFAHDFVLFTTAVRRQVWLQDQTKPKTHWSLAVRLSIHYFSRIDHDFTRNSSRKDVEIFYNELVELDRSELNVLQIGEYPKWARRVLDGERCRRKELGDEASPPTKKEKKSIISKGMTLRQPNRQPSVRTEIEGDYLHDALAEEATFRLTYDRSVKYSVETSHTKTIERPESTHFKCKSSGKGRYSERSIVGTFTCKDCILLLLRPRAQVLLFIEIIIPPRTIPSKAREVPPFSGSELALDLVDDSLLPTRHREEVCNMAAISNGLKVAEVLTVLESMVFTIPERATLIIKVKCLESTM